MICEEIPGWWHDFPNIGKFIYSFWELAEAHKAVNFEFINLGFGQKKHNISTHIACIRFVYMRFGEIIHIYPSMKLLLPVYLFIMYTIGAINRMKKK